MKLNYQDPRGATRHFTIANSPTGGENAELEQKITSDQVRSEKFSDY